IGISLRKAENVLERGAAEGVDGLGVIAHDGHVLLELRHAVDDLALETIRVLILVDEDVVEGGPELRGRRRDLVEKLLPEKEQIVVIHGVALALALAVALKDRDDLGLELRKMGRVLGEDLGK